MRERFRDWIKDRMNRLKRLTNWKTSFRIRIERNTILIEECQRSKIRINIEIQLIKSRDNWIIIIFKYRN